MAKYRPPFATGELRDGPLPETEVVTSSRKARPDNRAGPLRDPSSISPDAVEPRPSGAVRAAERPGCSPLSGHARVRSGICALQPCPPGLRRFTAHRQSRGSGARAQPTLGTGAPGAGERSSQAAAVPGTAGFLSMPCDIRLPRSPIAARGNAPRSDRGPGWSGGNDGTLKNYEEFGTSFLRPCREYTQQKYQQLESQDG